MRPDQSAYLAHFTKGEQAYENLVYRLLDLTSRVGAPCIPLIG